MVTMEDKNSTFNYTETDTIKAYECFKRELENLMKRIFITTPYNPSVKFISQSDICKKINSVTMPYYGTSYSKIIKTDIEMNISRIMR